MADLPDFPPIFRETVASIRARLDADVNAGVAPTSPDFVDTTEGGVYSDLAQAFALECSRLWDALASDTIAAIFPAYSWGTYLDQHGALIGVARKDASKATGEVTFSGTNGTLVPTGTVVAVLQSDPDADAVEFRTTASGTIASGTLTVAVEAAEAGATGNAAASTVTVLLSPVSGVSAVTNALPITGGADVETDEDYRTRVTAAYLAPQGAGTVADYERWALEYPGVGFATAEPLWGGAGTVRVIVTDAANDPVSQTVIDGLQAVLDPPAASTLLNGTQSVAGATITVDSTTGFRAGPDKIVVGGSQVISYTGLTGTTFTGCTGGSGTVTDNTPVTQGGQGAGRAPIGAIVTVATPAGLTITVAATITYETGYSATGTSGTVAIGDAIKAAITAYIDGLKPGGDVIRNHVIAAIFSVVGVLDVTALTLNGSATNAAVAATQVAATGTITLS